MSADRFAPRPLPPQIVRTQNHRRGILLMMAATATFCLGDSAVKYMTRDFDVMQIVWARYTFHAVLFLVLFSRTGLKKQMATRRPILQLTRSALLLTATVMFFTGLRFLPLADAAAIIFSVPLFVTALSIPILGEKVGIHRWVAILVGFLGILLIIRPGLGVMHWASVLPLGCAFCYAIYQILTRIASRTEQSVGSLFWTSAVGMVVTSAIAPFFWTAPSAFYWTLMAVTGFAFGFGHFLLIKGFEIAPASVLSPFGYSQIIWATVLGYILFDAFPDGFTIAGGAIVILSGLYIWYRETRARGEPVL